MKTLGLWLSAAIFGATQVDAATINFNMTLQIDRISWGEVEVYGNEGVTLFEQNRYDKGQDEFGSLLYHPLSYLDVGNVVNFSATILTPGDTLPWGHAPSCRIGTYNCSNTIYYGDFANITDDAFFIQESYNPLSSISGGWRPGDFVSFFWVPDYGGGAAKSEDGSTTTLWRNSWVDMTVVESSLSPVPLPASLPLLGLGMIGLAALGRTKRRRRFYRKSVSVAPPDSAASH